MNMGTTLAVYASICKELGRPMTDARLLAKHLVWAGT
jgi:hypothetical protein